MTLNDFMKRIDLGKNKDKMLLWSDGIGWTNVEIKKDNCCITLPCKENSPFTSDK